MQLIGNTLRKLLQKIIEHRHVLLTGAGVAGAVLTAVTSIRATIRAVKTVKMKEKEKHRKLTKKEVLKYTWKHYIWAGLALVSTITTIIFGHKLRSKEMASAAAAIALAEKKIDEYDKVLSEKSPEEAEQIKKEINEKVSAEPENSGVFWFYDEHINMWFRKEKAEVDAIIKSIRDRVKNGGEMFVSANDFYQELGLGHFIDKDRVGWNADDDCYISVSSAWNPTKYLLYFHLDYRLYDERDSYGDYLSGRNMW